MLGIKTGLIKTRKIISFKHGLVFVFSPRRMDAYNKRHFTHSLALGKHCLHLLFVFFLLVVDFCSDLMKQQNVS